LSPCGLDWHLHCWISLQNSSHFISSHFFLMLQNSPSATKKFPGK
jgi:hypothetical protein